MTASAELCMSKQLPRVFEAELERIESALAADPKLGFCDVSRALPLEVFAALTLGTPDGFPHIRSRMPSMPSDEVQNQWTGNCGWALMTQSLSFVRSLLQFRAEIPGVPIGECNVLDFGCGWGRLLRLMLKFVPEQRLFGVDPWDQSIDLCRKHGLGCYLAQSERLPENLPFRGPFDVIFAFSVFTHLSAKGARIALSALRAAITGDGFLCITIRPVEYWQHHGPQIAEQMTRAHDSSGFAFLPHAGFTAEGEAAYGDASMSVDFLRQLAPGWRIVGTEWSSFDPLQLIVVLLPDKT